MPKLSQDGWHTMNNSKTIKKITNPLKRRIFFFSQFFENLICLTLVNQSCYIWLISLSWRIFFCKLFWDRTVISVFHLFSNVKMTWESKKCVCVSGIMILITFKMPLYTVTEQNVTIVLTSWWDQFKYVFRMILAST